jgi:H+-translocating NAD(P) transhydrogenase subunit alpha
MNTIGSVNEDLSFEKRISITPDTAKKFIDLGFSINLEKKYGEHIGIKDEQYKKFGVNIHNTKKEVFEKSNIILKVNGPSSSEIDLAQKESIIIAQFDPQLYQDPISELIKKNIKIFSLTLLPRITRAQSMDVLSSQANLAGYKAVIESFSKFEQAIPMMMTAAGTVPAAKVLVIGAGVAGLQAIATAKRMGAIVFATDVRTASKEQVESLGGKFLMVEGSENLETEGGYAKETSEDFQKKQETLLSETLKKIDIVICTALIPGKKAPLIIKENMIKDMKTGSLIYDLAASQGGNSAFVEVDKVVEKNGVKIMGERNILNKLPISSSNLYAKNLLNFVLNIYDKKNTKININLEDEIIKKTLIK